MLSLVTGVPTASLYIGREGCNAFRPRGLFLLSEVCVFSTDLGRLALLYIVQEARVLVGLQCRVLVGLHDSNVTRITWEES
jgi:hypothetical protein